MSRKNNRKLHNVIRPVATVAAPVPAPSAARVTTAPAPIINRNVQAIVAAPATAPQASIADDKAPAGKRGVKAELQARVLAEKGYPAPKTWTVAKLEACLRGELTPRSAAVKTAVRAKVETAFGKAAPKSWTIAKCLNAIETGKAPGRSSGGLTADKCRELLSAARKNGVAIPAYSKLNADGLRALVASLKLAE